VKPSILRSASVHPPAGFTKPATDLPSPSNLSPRLHPDTRLADSKSHHRQTSIVHGVQHSRNGSFASSTSPLSPQMIAAAGADASSIGEPSFVPTMSSITSGASFISGSTQVGDRGSAAAEGSAHSLTQKRVERMHSGRNRRDHGHLPSHSRHHHKDELKTVGEYALHVLFTSVSTRKPNLQHPH
jgi:hypothetical protein